PVLWHKGNTSNLFVGVNAGAAITSGNDNTFMGSGAASLNSIIGNKNTMVGRETGLNLSQGIDNTFMGYRAGYSYTFGNNSTFIGSGAGYNENFDEDVYIGWHAGYNSTNSLHCTFVGNGSGLATTGGYQDVFIGIGSGAANVTGANCVAIGGGAGMSLPNLQNAIAIGDASSVTGSNQMILGNSNVKVGVGLSGITPGPSNWLEINTPAPSPAAAASGLRFRDMTTVSPTTPNPGPGLLSVDNNGDVIYVAAPSGGGLGNSCSSPQVPLLSDHEIPLNTFDFFFSGDGTNDHKVNIGFPCGSPKQPGKLNVTTNFQSDPSSTNDSYSIYGTNTYGGLFSNNTGVYGSAISTGLGTHETGVWGVASGDRQAIGVHGQAGVVASPGGPAYGGYFEASTAGNTFNYGVESIAANAPDNLAVDALAFGGTTSNTGIHAQAFGAVTTNAGIFEAWGGSVTNIGVTGRAFPVSITNPSTYPTMVNIGVYGNAPLTPTSGTLFGFAGYFDGDVWINGPATGTGFAVTSDQMFKTRVDTISNALKIISQLKPKTFFYKTDNRYGMNFSDKRQYGVIAQEVEKVLPELIINTKKPAMVDSSGKVVTEGVAFKAVNYDAFIGILIRSVQQLQEQNEKQDSLIRLLSAALNPGGNKPAGAGSNPEKLANQSGVTLSDEDIIVLNQNVPNPFSEQTSITYYLPEGVGVAKIMFYNSRGQRIKVCEITTRGEGRLKVYASDLSTGMYTYSLVADGKIVDTKKMMKQQ
ncbi:MAG: tail fiber domain-containing protein, partial [Bacteroidota bacterium]